MNIRPFRSKLAVTLIILMVAGSIGGWVWWKGSKLEGQYRAPQFSCSCEFEMVLDFHEGRVRLFNTGHKSLYDAGTYERAGEQWIWHLPDHGLSMKLEEGFSEVRIHELSTGRTMSFERSFRLVERNLDEAEEMVPLKTFISDLGPHFEQFGRLP